MVFVNHYGKTVKAKKPYGAAWYTLHCALHIGWVYPLGGMRE